tara:strand:- start:497 stop:1342 length:846 start_codon:yes stop_codon:yes gene_type:complete
MARINKGNALTTPVQQPGGKFSGDGYGLTTATVVWKADQTASLNSVINRGSTCPLSGASYCDAHKYSITYDSLGIATITVDYVGIDSSVGGSGITKPQITGSQGLTAEHITTHPNFYTLASAAGFSGTPIAGFGSGGTATTPNYAAVSGTTPTEYEGNNGATFELAIGRKFLGFKKALYPDFYGKTNYLAPQSSISGIFYTSNAGTTVNLRNAVGKTSGNGTFASILLTPDYMGTSFLNGSKHQLLLAQISFEDFGTLYKIQYELRFNREGYNASTYASAS